MNRRKFLKFLAAVPFVGLVLPICKWQITEVDIESKRIVVGSC